MATVVDDVIYLPIGCSCINQFQLNYRFGVSEYESQLFDWSITTPDSTVEILKKKGYFLTSLDDIELFKKNMFYSRKMPGYLVWHLDKILPQEVLPIMRKFELSPFYDQIVGKHNYQINKLFGINNIEV